jgi:hypothetical protein
MQVSRPEEVATALDAGQQALADVQAQRAHAAIGPVPPSPGEGQHPDDGFAAGHHGAGHHGPAGPGSVEHDGHGPPDGGEDARHAGGGHAGHDMGGMGMPAGLPMAERGADRDGLTLDQLHVPLGPILPDWPAGLGLRLVVQGDVIQQVEVETHGGEGVSSWWTQPWRAAAAGEDITYGAGARRGAAAHLDSLGRFLAVAGWDDAATAARRLRDDLLAEAPAARLHAPVRRFARRVARSRTLRWSTHGLGTLRAAEASAAGVSGPAVRADGDVVARYRQWLTEVVDDLARLDDPTTLDPTSEGPRGRLAEAAPPSAALLDVLPGLLVGTELAAARLIVASLDPDLDGLAAVRQVVGHG